MIDIFKINNVTSALDVSYFPGHQHRAMKSKN